jgi:hypothetical protein
MSNIIKYNKTPSISELIERQKRNTAVNVALSKDPAMLQKSLVRQTGFNSGFFSRNVKRGFDVYNARVFTVTASSSGGLLGSIKIVGFNVGTLTQAETDAFKQQFALKYGVSANLLTITLTPGSLIVTVSANSIPDISQLSLSEKSFFSNLDAVFNSISPLDIDTLITDSNLTADITKTGAPLTIDTTYTVINTALDIVQECKNDSEYKKRNINEFLCPLTGDPINDCMYSMVRLKPSAISVVKIRNNGTVDKICNYADNVPPDRMYLNMESTYLIMLSNKGDTFNPLATRNGNSPNLLSANKIYLINIATGAISTITLTETYNAVANDYGFEFRPQGYNKLTRRVYYESGMDLNYGDECYVTIPANYSSATITATYLSNWNLGRAYGVIEFIDSDRAFVSLYRSFYLVDFRNPGGTETLIAGAGLDTAPTKQGAWSNPSISQAGPYRALWLNDDFTNFMNSPFLDSPIGTNAWISFSFGSFAYDSENNRLIIADSGSQRIRTIDLTPGSNNAVTTLAGTSPTFSGFAINSSTSTYSQALLNTLLQVGDWNNGFNGMPAYTEVNDTFLNSTFNRPLDITVFNGKIYVRQENNIVRQLSNGSVSSFFTTLLFTD